MCCLVMNKRDCLSLTSYRDDNSKRECDKKKSNLNVKEVKTKDISRVDCQTIIS